MNAVDYCPHCGLRLGKRGDREPAGQMYRCRKCKGVVLLVKKYRSGECMFIGKPDGAAGGVELQTIPRV